MGSRTLFVTERVWGSEIHTVMKQDQYRAMIEASESFVNAMIS